MENGLKLILADPSVDYRKEFVSAVLQDKGFTLVGETGNGLELFHMTRILHPDAIIMDLRLEGADGISVMEKLSEMDERPIIIVHSSLKECNQSALASLAEAKVAAYFISRTSAPKVLLQRTRQVLRAWGSLPSTAVSLDETINDILSEFNIPNHLQGYKYLRESIHIALRQEKDLNRNKPLSEIISDHFNIRWGTLDGTMYEAVKQAWVRSDETVWKKYFGKNQSDLKHTPSPLKFIRVLSHFIEVKKESGS